MLSESPLQAIGIESMRSNAECLCLPHFLGELSWDKQSIMYQTCIYRSLTNTENQPRRIGSDAEQ
jgi:hypothetical protein